MFLDFRGSIPYSASVTALPVSGERPFTLGLEDYPKMNAYAGKSHETGKMRLSVSKRVLVIVSWLILTVSGASGLDVPVYYGIFYPSAKHPPILESFIVKDGQLLLQSAYVDTDNDFVLDSIILFFEDTEPKLSSITPDEGDPFWDGSPLGIKVPPKASFNKEIRLDSGGVKYRISFIGRNYPKPQHPSNSKWRNSRIYQKFVGGETEAKTQHGGSRNLAPRR